ncbi:MAG TPA: hypothetical protein VMB85_07735 [Bryobacteraceae bacterium]|nr:hypothetical protein [Bryobacteraceae bacterium]
MSVAAGLKPDWKQWEGEIVDERFPLERLLMEFANGAVFRTRAGSAYGAIRLVQVRDVDRLVECWSRAQPLDHPNLIRIFKVGTWTKADAMLAYVVTEYAEENLAMVLKERALTPDEVSEMVGPLVDTLAFLHERGTTLGGLEPSQICAVRDTLKISSGILAGSDGSADLRGLAATVTEALTQKAITFPAASEPGIAESLPEPFAELVRKCLGPSSCSATELAQWWRAPQQSDLSPISMAMTDQPVAPPRANRTSAGLWIFAVIVALTIGSLWLKKHHSTPVPVPAKEVTAAEPPVISAPAPTAPSTAPIPKRESAAAHPAPAVHGQVVHQVLPDIPAKDRRTIRGKATVIVGVVVDPSGHVTETILERGSRYFGRRATEAANQWRFASASGTSSREYYLRFEITRSDTKVVLQKTPGTR